MRKFVLSAVAITAFAALSAPALAEISWGPTKNGAQCFTPSPGWSKDGFGYWGACPQPAAAPVAAKPRARRNAAR